MRLPVATLLVLLTAAPLGAQGVIKDPKPVRPASDAIEFLERVKSYSCSPRKTCTRISSCQEANWLLANCSWGGKLDRDNDGRPCESGPC